MTSNPSPGEPEGAAEPIRDPRPEGVRVPRREAPAGRPGAPGIRWGRTAIALVGLVGLLGAALTAVLSPFTGIGWPLPVFLVIVGIGALASLRYLALSDREARRAGGTTSRPAAPAASPASTARRAAGRPQEGRGADRASSPAMEERPAARPEASARPVTERSEAPEREASSAAHRSGAARPSARAAEPAARRRTSSEAEATATASHRTAPRRPTAAAAPQARLYDRAPQAPAGASSREAPRTGLEELRAQAKRSAALPSEAFRAAGSTWDPVEVPKPTYVDAPEAHRERPEPLTPPAEPEARSKSLEEASRPARPIDLDDVLSRRRA